MSNRVNLHICAGIYAYEEANTDFVAASSVLFLEMFHFKLLFILALLWAAHGQSSRIEIEVGDVLHLTCPTSDSNNIIWRLPDDGSRTGQELTITMSRSSLFGTYQCVDRQENSLIQSFQVMRKLKFTTSGTSASNW